jgi:2-desacetyl-2-hydroxyethyl bacteriochlorophyllide A dehydrogenase
MQNMQGIVFRGGRQLEFKEVPDPRPGEGEVVVAIKASGMCGSDLHHYRGADHVSPETASIIGGHEPAGVVHETGPGVSPLVAKVGDRVMVHHYKGCMACRYCHSGWPQMCSDTDITLYGTTDHGAHAPYMRVPAASLVKLDGRLSFEAGAAIGCGTGTAWGALNRLGDVGGARLVVLGQGPVGLSATMLAAARGAQVIAVDIEPARLERARHFGAAHVVDGKETDVAAAIMDLTHGSGPELGLETSGSNAAGRSMLDSLAPWGRACYVGMGATIELNVIEYLFRQLTVMTSWTMSLMDLQDCASFIADHQLPVDDLFTHRWDLAEADQAYAEFDKQAAGKGVFLL